MSLGRLAPAESREGLSEESFKVLGDCGVAVLGIDISQLDKPRVTETFDFCFYGDVDQVVIKTVWHFWSRFPLAGHRHWPPAQRFVDGSKLTRQTYSPTMTRSSAFSASISIGSNAAFTGSS